MGVTSKLSVSVAATAAFWLLFGYRYFVNAGIETVPIIKRALDPMYMGNDYYLQFITEGYNHRLVYTEVVAFVSALFGSVESAICILYVVFMFALDPKHSLDLLGARRRFHPLVCVGNSNGSG